MDLEKYITAAGKYSQASWKYECVRNEHAILSRTKSGWQKINTTIKRGGLNPGEKNDNWKNSGQLVEKER